MDENDWLIERFEEHRPHLRAVAYRMLGSSSEADDAVQDTWLRVSRSGVDGVENLGGWLTTITARLCLNTLRARTTRRESSLEAHQQVPDPVVTLDSRADPEHDAMVADSVGLALMVVLDRLNPAERLAFVLHDMFAVPYDEIGPMVGRSAAAARQLASRARRRVQGAAPIPDADVTRQRAVVDAFFAAARRGDFDALVAMLDPDVVARTDRGPGATMVAQGASAVANQALTYARPAATLEPALVNGAAGVVVSLAGRPVAVMAFAVQHDRIVAIDSLVDAARLADLDLRDLAD